MTYRSAVDSAFCCAAAVHTAARSSSVTAWTGALTEELLLMRHGRRATDAGGRHARVSGEDARL